MKRLFFLSMCIVGFLVNPANAATITAVSSGGWYTNSTWSCNCQPSNNDNVVIPTGITVSITAGPVILTGGPVITVTIFGTLSLISGGTLIVDSNDIVKVMTGGKIMGTGILDAVWSGGVPIWVPNGTSVNGPRTITGGSLPITLLYFNATPENRSVQLQWASATEINFDHYVIGRSVDGINFEDIGQVSGAGNSIQRIEYTFEDRAPLSGASYYRLQSVDIDLTIETFDMVMVEWAGSAIEPMTIYPNPVAGTTLQTTLNFPVKDGVISIYDSQGRTVTQQGINADASTYSMELPTGTPRGIYFVVVRTENESLKRTLIVP